MSTETAVHVPIRKVTGDTNEVQGRIQNIPPEKDCRWGPVVIVLFSQNVLIPLLAVNIIIRNFIEGLDERQCRALTSKLL